MVVVAIYGTILVALGALLVGISCLIGELLPRKKRSTLLQAHGHDHFH